MMIVRSICLLLVLILQACSSSTYQGANSSYSTHAYTVKTGDTLFSIAMTYDLDFKELANSNRIPPPYTIYVGEMIYLSSGIFSEVPSKKAETATSRVSTPPYRAPQINPAPKKVVQEQKKTGVSPNYGVKHNATLHKVNKVAPVAPAVRITSNDQSWIWPVDGQVIKQFVAGDALSKGIDIQNKIGSPILAAREGEVVYAGNGLKGYGNLIIIRHDDIYISAYAHNNSVFVKEGDFIKKGQKIADLGTSGTDIPKLHFEIRRQGKPINPIQLLPKK